MHPMDIPSPGRAVAARAARVAAALLAAVFACAPMGASAETRANLPKGYTSDELPALPPSVGTPVQPATDEEEAVDGALAADSYSDTDPSALTDFEEPLAPYGTWVEDPTYGTVWVPSSVVVGADFAPYQTGGRWAMTDDGDWLWVSDYEWGYIPFHYGRWVWIAGRGWAWIPGRVYAPAWVVWRTGDFGYIGWAPMPPAYYWSSGSAVTLWMVPPAAYVFVPTTHVFHHHVHHHVVRDRATVHQIAAKTHVYKPASPSMGGGKHGAASGHASGSGSASGAHRYTPASPSLAEAKIPSGAAPKARMQHDRRAAAFARPSTTPKAKALGSSGRGKAPGFHAGGRPAPALEPGREPRSLDELPRSAGRPGAIGRGGGGARDARSRGGVIRTPSGTDAPAFHPPPRQGRGRVVIPGGQAGPAPQGGSRAVPRPGGVPQPQPGHSRADGSISPPPPAVQRPAAPAVPAPQAGGHAGRGAVKVAPPAPAPPAARKSGPARGGKRR